MKKSSALIVGAIFVALTGCSTQARQGQVAMKIDDTVAHVSFSPGELRAGDSIKIERNECTSTIDRNFSRARSKTDCRLVIIGRGSLTEVLNDHYGVAKLDRPVVFKEGDKVSKDNTNK